MRARLWLVIVLLIAQPACDLVLSLSPREPPADAPVDAAPQRAALQDDFEDGLDPRWIRALENGDRCELTTDHAVSGSHAVVCQTDGTSGSKASLLLPFESTTKLRVQLNVRFATLPALFVTFLQTSHTSATQNQRLVVADFYPSSRIDVWNDGTMGFDYVPRTIALDTWYHLDFHAWISSTAGGVDLVVDGTDRAALTDVDTTDLPITQLQLGIALLSRPIEQMTIYIDDVVISEE